ncbi:MAG: hypothetical protein HY257_07765 [Chloroflexi bacterium]|nr:hypothetical protein [Chloroflexota bacterium]
MLQLWIVASQAQTALIARYRPTLLKIANDLGLDLNLRALLTAALTYEPDAISARYIANRIPYTSDAVPQSQLEQLAAKGFLNASNQTEFRLTDTGRAAAKQIYPVLDEMNSLDVLSRENLARLAQLLNRVADAFQRAPEPPSKWCVTRARRLRIANAQSVSDIYFSLAEMNAYRDDCHLGAWRAQKLRGEAWEAFTLVWRGDAKNADELFEKLKLRGHIRDAYADALNDLAKRGWIEQKDGVYAATANGKKLREDVETQTDKNFYAAWNVLSDGEQKELENLLIQFRDALK